MATANARMFPPGDAKHSSVKLNGRSYNVIPNGFLDVPAFDAACLSANGWTRFGGRDCIVGPTSARPTQTEGLQPLAPDQPFFDTTLNQLVTWDRLAQVWRGPTGASA